MLVAPRFRGLDLRMLEPESGIVYEPRLLRKDLEDRDNVVRAVHVQAPRFMGNLMRVLEKTDRELDKIADMCGGVVARHEWCLYPVENIPSGFQYMFDPKDLKRLGVPEGHIVAADVEWVQEGKSANRLFTGDEPYDRVENGLDTYFSSWGLKQGDAHVRQFVFTSDSTPVYVDLDPSLYVHCAGWGNFWG